MSATASGHANESTRQLDVTNVPADDLCSYAAATNADGVRLYFERKGGRTYLIRR